MAWLKVNEEEEEALEQLFAEAHRRSLVDEDGNND